MAKIFLKGGTEHTLINGVRELFYQPFEATGWTDLRVGWFLSVCGETDPGEDDTITGLTGNIAGVNTPWTDRFAIGLTDRASGHTFCGFTNASMMTGWTSYGGSKLVSSDIGFGTTTTDYWRPKNEFTDVQSIQIVDGGRTQTIGGVASQIHFVQNYSGGHAAGYATLLMLRFTRPDAGNRAKIITMSTKAATGGGHSGDVLFTSDPSKTTLAAQLEAFPTTVETLGPITLSHAPDSMYLYWPFTESRIRCHAWGILKAA